MESALVGADQLDFAARRASAVHRGGSGEIRVGILPLLTGERLREVLRVFRKRHPNVSAFLTEGSLREIGDAVTTGKLDIGFVVGHPDLPACRLQTLGTEPLVVVLPTNHRLAHCDLVNWHAIEDETFVVCRNGSGADIQEFLLSRLARPGFRPRIDIHDVSHASVIDIVRMNYGITIASASYFSLDVAGVVLRPLEGKLRR
ncbi:LysR family substrate-binding domain-containing protein [Pedomonas mirosovicensis]|uniref:LysR family substrate-binding domain-containing protein n=1 Tax=Pedomonas mirosovicensis TaxID=2908641 RepID=UPI0021683438|nr:LysR family substrate-binding domain-containing protein [Pedomonas mirosovicensis]MCH8684424.1 LysR family substrate-binding domain-containing protein [Pedomonas mirosovicensis]